MPRLRQNHDRDTLKDFVDEVNAQCGRFGYRSQKALGDALGVCQATAGNYLKKPESIPFGVLRTLVKLLHPDPVLLLKALGYTTQDIQKIKGESQ